MGGAPAGHPARGGEPELEAEFFARCDSGAEILHEQARTEKRIGRAFYWDAYVARALCVAYDMTGKQSYLDACKAWSGRMLEYQSGMIPEGAYYMTQWGSKFGGLPFHVYVSARHVPGTEKLAAAADRELRYIAEQLDGAEPSNQRDQLALFAVMSYAEKLRPGAVYCTSRR